MSAEKQSGKWPYLPTKYRYFPIPKPEFTYNAIQKILQSWEVKNVVSQAALPL